MASDPRALIAAMMQQSQGGGQPQQQPSGQDPAAIIAQLAAMPPKQAQTLVQMNKAQAQQQGNQAEFQIWTQVEQMLMAAMQAQAPAPAAAPQAQGNIVSQVLGGGM